MQDLLIRHIKIIGCLLIGNKSIYLNFRSEGAVSNEFLFVAVTTGILANFIHAR